MTKAEFMKSLFPYERLCYIPSSSTAVRIDELRKENPGSTFVIKFKPTGEYRKPKKREYFLSGSVIEAYKAPNDLSSQYHIAEPVIAQISSEIKEVI